MPVHHDTSSAAPGTAGRGAPRVRRVACALLLVPVVLAGCVADPPPPRSPGDTGGDSIPVAPGAVTFLVDDLGPGFNPHLRADLGPVTDLLSSLTLPSAYTRQADGTYLRNGDLVTSVTEVPGETFTLRYTLDYKAQWSDGVPIGAEDFRYLWQTLAQAPGTVGASEGYRHITDVRPGAGGKVVDVVFDSRYPRWRELFTNLLPAHLMNQGGPSLATVLAQGAPASGGPFKVGSADLGTGEIVLTRNDRYWAQPPQAEQVVVRLARDASTLGQAARVDTAEAVLVADTDVNKLVVDTVGGFTTGTAGSDAQLNLTWNVSADGFDDRGLRAALGRYVDAETVARIVGGIDDPQVAAFPLASGTEDPRGADVEAGDQALRELGFTRVDGRWARDEVPLEVTLGVEAGDEQAVLAAATVADQLRAAGVGARVWELDAAELYSGALPYGLVQGVVTWTAATGDPLTQVAARYRCLPAAAALEQSADEAGTVTSATGPSLPPASVTELQPPPEVAAAAGASTTVPNPTITVSVPAGDDGRPAPPPARSTNLSGFCDREIDSALDTATAEQAEAQSTAPQPGDTAAPAPITVDSTVPAEVRNRLAEASLDIPLWAPRLLVGSGSKLAGFQVPAGDGHTARELFHDAKNWRAR